jgi:hypothetical protein
MAGLGAGTGVSGRAGELPDLATQERVARNDATFREANERIADVAERVGEGQRFPFLCECAERGCTEIVRMTAEEYWHVRDNPRWFVNAPGHEVAARGAGAVVETYDGYVVVEKLAHAGEIVEQLEGDASLLEPKDDAR